MNVSSQPSSSSRPEKHNYASRACNACKKRKGKCIGDPCAYCSKKHITCQFNDGKKRGPPKKLKLFSSRPREFGMVSFYLFLPFVAVAAFYGWLWFSLPFPIFECLVFIVLLLISFYIICIVAWSVPGIDLSFPCHRLAFHPIFEQYTRGMLFLLMCYFFFQQINQCVVFCLVLKCHFVLPWLVFFFSFII